MAEQDRNKKGEEEQEGKRGDTRWIGVFRNAII